MNRAASDLDPDFKRVLDRLQITPEYLFDTEHDFGREAVSTTDKIGTDLVRPIGITWPFTGFWRINLDTLHKKLRTELDSTGTGYSYMITDKKKVVHYHASGFAQIPPPLSDGPIRWGLHTQMNVASVSKFVTAIAVVRLLREASISETSSIAGFLPPYWAPFGPGVSAITFRDLLRHEAGLRTGATDGTGAGNFAEAKAQVQAGSTGTGTNGTATYNYQNVNYAVLRVLFMSLPNGPPAEFDDLLPSTEDLVWNATSAVAYQNYVNEAVFVPANILPRDFSAPDNVAKAYSFPVLAFGTAIVDGLDACAQSGWHLNAGEVARLMGEFRAGTMMPSQEAARVLSDMYGLDRPLPTKAGRVYRKGGRKLSGQQGVDSVIYMMPGNANLAVLANSVPLPPTALPLAPGTVWPSHLDGIPDVIHRSMEFVF